MYLKEIYLENTGPISKCHVELPFDGGNPLPTVMVGPNGSGKTIFLSYIVDALIEFGKEAFDDIVPFDSSGRTPYFRFVQPTAIRSGQSFSLSLLHFKANDDNLYYCEKSGVLDPAIYSPNVKSVFTPVWNWPTEENHKNVSVNQKTVEAEMRKGAYAFFPASRREVPDWLNPRSIEGDINASASRHFSNQLDKSIWVETCAEENIGWILDVLLDSSIDVELLWRLQVAERGERILPNASLSQIRDIKDRNILRNAIRNVDRVLEKILQNSTAKLRHTFRNHRLSRLVIELEGGQTILNPNSLSGGQSQLFHLFTTIIRYGESTDINKSIHLRDITGLVIIDEVDVNLHPTLQYDVLPQLIEMFPKIQFIVSSHSPLFLLGMEKRFGSDKVTILELPDGDRINSERYSEFGKAFEYYQSTQSFEDETKRRFAAGTKPLVLTEGPLDVRYIRRALDVLGKNELLNSLDIEFVGIEDHSGKTRFGGDTWLNNFRNIYEANTSLYHRPILLLYDCDTQKPDEQVGDGERLWIRSIKQNRENTKVRKGIENLFPEDMFTAEFYTSKVETGDYGESKSIQEFNKPKFCDWICENGSDINFAKFDRMVEILKQFSEAYTEPPVQQPFQ